MPILEWHDRVYATGVAPIDTEHRELVAMINAAHDRGWLQGDREALEQVIRDMARYAARHFATEEALMARHGYPGAADHWAAHRAFEVRAAEYQEACRGGEALDAQGVFRYLAQWLSEHILEVDASLGTYLRQQGVVLDRSVDNL